MFSEYFDAGYWADGYWTVSGGSPDGPLRLELSGALAGVGGRITLELLDTPPPTSGGGGGGSVRREDVLRMLDHLRGSRLRIRGDLDSVRGRVELAAVRSALLRAELDGASGRVVARLKYGAAIIRDEDEEWMLWLT